MEPQQPVRFEFKPWSLLAARALDDCHRVLETIEPDDTAEANNLDELRSRVQELFVQALVLHGLTTRSQLDQATPFGRMASPESHPTLREPTDWSAA